MEKKEVKKQLCDLSKEGEGGTVLPAALLDLIEAGEKTVELAEKSAESAEKTRVTLEGELKNAKEKSEKFIKQLSTLESALKEIMSSAQSQATGDTKKLIEQLSTLEPAITKQNVQKFAELKTTLKEMLDDARSKSAEEFTKNLSMISVVNKSIKDARLEHAATGKKLSWSIGLSAVAAIAILALLVMEIIG